MQGWFPHHVQVFNYGVSADLSNVYHHQHFPRALFDSQFRPHLLISLEHAQAGWSTVTCLPSRCLGGCHWPEILISACLVCLSHLPASLWKTARLELQTDLLLPLSWPNPPTHLAEFYHTGTLSDIMILLCVWLNTWLLLKKKKKVSSSVLKECACIQTFVFTHESSLWWVTLTGYVTNTDRLTLHNWLCSKKYSNAQQSHINALHMMKDVTELKQKM